MIITFKRIVPQCSAHDPFFLCLFLMSSISSVLIRWANRIRPELSAWCAHSHRRSFWSSTTKSHQHLDSSAHARIQLQASISASLPCVRPWGEKDLPQTMEKLGKEMDEKNLISDCLIHRYTVGQDIPPINSGWWLLNNEIIPVPVDRGEKYSLLPSIGMGVATLYSYQLARLQIKQNSFQQMLLSQ